MNKTPVATQAKTASVLPPTQGIIQRKCACGNHTGAGGECADCAKKKSGLQRKLAIGASNDPLEQEADRVADQVMAAPVHSAVSGTPPHIQRFTGHSTGENGTAPVSVDRVLASIGRPLEPTLRQDMEQRFGHDFSRVRVHSDAAAEQSARDVNANAYTLGHDIVFGAGGFAPGTPEGQRLIAHELTHVAQQRSFAGIHRLQRAIGDGHDLKSPRFAKQEQLENAFDPPGPIIGIGDFGLHVRIIQQALIDAGQTLPSGGVDGIFKTETETAVKGFQTSQGLTGADVTGIIDAKTMGLLDAYFLNHAALVTIPQSKVPSTAPTEGVEWSPGGTPAELVTGTRTLKANEKAEIKKRRTTEVQAPVGGILPDFHSTIMSTPDSYEKRIEDITTAVVDAQFDALGKDKGTMHADLTKLHRWSDIEKVAEISKRETDRVFGNFALGKAFKQSVNIKDAWDDKESQFAAGGAAFEQGSVEWRVNKIIQAPDVTGTIDLEHGAVQSRTTLSPGEPKSEAAIITDVRNRIISTRRAKLIETHKGWPGYADPTTRTVFIQRFKESSDAKNRDFMWDMFQTLVHEYIHTLAHSRYSAYARSLDESKGGKTYREGMTEYFTKMVLESAAIDAAFRKDVEGPFHNPLVVHPIPVYGGYREAANAEAVAGVAGLRNVMAAFFLGKINLIGG